jgi:hypothetical protein
MGPAPCGYNTGDGVITPVTGGSKLMLEIRETVPHGGFYRVALATKDCKKGADCFPADNKVYDKNNMLLSPMGPGESDHADFEMNPTFPILADHLFAHQATAPQTFTDSTTITVPNFNCDQCTLQVIEFMAPHGADYFYHHCADLKITADAGKPIFDPNNPGGGGMGGAGGMSGAGAGGVVGVGGVATGGTGGASGGTAGAPTSGAGAGGASAGSPGGGVPGTGGSGGAAAGTTTTGATSGDSGGCTVSMTRGTGAGASMLAALGISMLLRRRRRAG